MQFSPQLDLTKYEHGKAGPGGQLTVTCPVCGRLGSRRKAHGIAVIAHAGYFDIINGTRVMRVTDSCVTRWRERQRTR